MNTLIKAMVVNRIVTIENDPVTKEQPIIMCGNSDYVIEFSFDTEWDNRDIKTARFVVTRGKITSHTDVVFSGNKCAVPVMTGVELVYVGVFAGDLNATCKAGIRCTKSILCDDTYPDPPPPDLYNQIMALIANTNGKSAFIRFSSEPDGEGFTEFWREGQYYIGFATAVFTPTNKEDFIWTRISSGPQGEPGPKGDPGLTPQKGVDYWTENDKAEIKSYVDNAILNGAW